MRFSNRSIEQAFDNTDPSYLQKSLEQRNPGPNSAGSTFLIALGIDDLKYADWKPANDPDIKSPAIGFRANIQGLMGIAELSSLPTTQRVIVQPAHKGQSLVKEGPYTGTPAAECAAVIPDSNRKVEFTTLILGPDRNDPNKLVVWTFFPGPAGAKFPDIAMVEVQEKFGVSDGPVEMSVIEAEGLGFHYCKHVNSIR